MTTRNSISRCRREEKAEKDKTEIYAFVDTAVAGDKVAAVTLVSRTTGKKVESPLIPSLKVDEMKVIRNTTIVYSQKDSKVVDTRNVHTAPDYLDPSKISETATLANAALVRFALDNDEKGEHGRRLSEKSGRI